jgi:alkylhydroperoxidase/carboxymuconolactone decarboxylase family protein YurZ
LAGDPVDAALKAGATREEIAATLATAISLNAGTAYIYSLHALAAYDSLKSRGAFCCSRCRRLR